MKESLDNKEVKNILWCKGANQLANCMTKQGASGFPLLNPFPNKPWFLRVYSIRLLKTLWKKEKLLVTSNFSFFLSVFCPFEKLYYFFIKFEIVVCKLFQFGKV